MNRGLFAAAASIVLSSSLAPGATAAEPKAPKPGGKESAVEAKRRAKWQADIAKVPLSKKKGCFKAEYPKMEWQEVPCGAPSKYPNPASGTPRPDIVGNGNDILMLVPAAPPGLLISSVVGSFDSVTPANVTESGTWNGVNTANAFTLQINTQFFTTPACNNVPGCQGWQQFIYSQNQCGGPCVFMEYWLLNFGPQCPAGNWIQSGNSCWFNSANSPAAAVTAAQLQGTTLTATAGAANDTVVLTSPGGNANAIANDNVLTLSQQWNQAEWNIFGDCCLTQANFAPAPTTIVPRMVVTDASRTAPGCQVGGFTGETNNLNFGPNAPAVSGPGPALFFTQSIAGGLVGCAAATSIGDTHLTTFGGTLYDFQASGDVILAKTQSPEFVVQTRQVSGAPNWPNATVNKAVGMKLGKTRAALCLPPLGLAIDGKPTQVEDGKALDLPDGAAVARHGNVYLFRDAAGDMVRAEINDPYINVAVGLGRWPNTVHGVLANADGNVNKIAARDGVKLTAPFPFVELYHHYADSWRATQAESLLSPCGEGKPEPGLPQKPFFAKDLPPKAFKSALAICKAAGVKVKPFLDACTLDVAVIGNESAAKVYVGLRPPKRVGDAVSGRRDQDHDRDDEREKEKK